MKANKYKKTNFFHKLDIFGNLFNFTINKEEKFKTNMGSVLSLITLIVIIITCIFFGTDFYNRTNPKVLSQKTVPENYTLMNISNKNLTISFRIEDSDGQEIDFSGLLFPTLVYSAMEMNPESKNLEFIKPVRNIPLKRCNETSNEENFYKVRNPEHWYCLNFDAEDLQLGGYWDGDFVYYYMLNINVCERDEESKKTGKCADFEELKKFLFQRVFITLNYPSVYFDFTDYHEPLKIEYKSHYSHITRNLLRSDFCYFNFPVIKDDRGWIFNDYQEQTSLSYDNCDRNYHFKFDNDYLEKESDDIIFGMDIYLGKSFPFYIRNYMKFQDLAAIVGGFVKLVTLAFGFLNFYFNTFERDKFIISYFFNIFDDAENAKVGDYDCKPNARGYFDSFDNKDFLSALKKKSLSDNKNVNIKGARSRENQHSLGNEPLSSRKDIKNNVNNSIRNKNHILSYGNNNNNNNNNHYDNQDLYRKKLHCYHNNIYDIRNVSQLNSKNYCESNDNSMKNDHENLNFTNNKSNNYNNNNNNNNTLFKENLYNNKNLNDKTMKIKINKKLEMPILNEKSEANNNNINENENEASTSKNIYNLAGNMNNSSSNFLNNKVNSTIQITPNRNTILKENLNYKNKQNEVFRATEKSKLEGTSNKNNNTNLDLDDNHATVINNKNEGNNNNMKLVNVSIKEKDWSYIEQPKSESKKKQVLFLNEKSEEKESFLGFFNFYLYEYLNCRKKNQRNYKLYKTISYIKDHINDKFDLLKYYKRFIHYKYLKKVILSSQQRNALKNISNIKIDYRMIYKNSNKKFYDENERNSKKLKMNLSNDIIDERIRELIDLKFS